MNISRIFSLLSAGFIFFSASAPKAAESNATERTVQMVVSPWSRICQDIQSGKALTKCSIPQSPGSDYLVQKLSFPLRENLKAGEVSVLEKEIKWPQELHLKISLYQIEPKSDSKWPAYVQVKAEWIAPKRALCAHSLAIENGDLAPLICASAANDESPTQWGITLQSRVE